MKKIAILFGIMMFSLTVMADGPQYGFMSRPEGSYGGYYNSRNSRSYQSQASSTKWNSNDTWVTPTGMQTAYGVSPGKLYSSDLDGSGNGEGLGDNRTGGLVGNALGSGDAISPVGDAIIPLSIMSLLFAGFIFLKKSKGGSI